MLIHYPQCHQSGMEVKMGDNKTEGGNLEFVRCIGDGIKTTYEMNRENMAGIQSDVETIIGALSELAGAWEGPAHDTYHNEFSLSIENLKDMNSRTKQVIDYEELAFNKYMDADGKAAVLIKELLDYVGATAMSYNISQLKDVHYGSEPQTEKQYEPVPHGIQNMMKQMKKPGLTLDPTNLGEL